MKIDRQIIIRDVKNSNFNALRMVLLTFCLVFLLLKTNAQELPFQDGETLNFDIRYKYGLVTMKAGTAKFNTDFVTFEKNKTIRSTLNFKTTSFFDKIYKMRDTLTSYASIPHLKPIFHLRIANEAGGHVKEEMKIIKHSFNYSEVNTKLYKKEQLSIDTTLVANQPGYDIISMLTFIRSLDYDKIKYGDVNEVAFFMGKKKINITIRSKGTAVISNNSKKYNTFLFSVDFTDEAFTESNSAMEVWISDDGNRIPIRLKAKLKIGAAEANLTSYKNLKYPLSSEINLKN